MSAKEKTKSPGVVFICGNDEFKVSESARAAVNAACPLADQALSLETIDGTVKIIDGTEIALKMCLDALQTVGFFGASKTVWLREATFLGDLDLLKNELVKPRLDALLDECKRGLLPGVHFVISSSSADGRSSFFKSLQAVSDFRKYDLPASPRDSEQSAREFIAQALKEAGLTARHDAIQALLNRCGGRREMLNEVEKLALYVMPRTEITVRDVVAIVSASRETAGWDLADHFGRRDLSAALRTLRQLLYQRESPHGLIAGLEGRIRDLLILKECVTRRWLQLSDRDASWTLPPDGLAMVQSLSKDPTKMHPYRTGLIARQSVRFTMDELAWIHRTVVETHEQILSSPVPPEMLLEIFLIRTMGGARRVEN